MTRQLIEFLTPFPTTPITAIDKIYNETLDEQEEYYSPYCITFNRLLCDHEFHLYIIDSHDTQLCEFAIFHEVLAMIFFEKNPYSPAFLSDCLRDDAEIVLNVCKEIETFVLYSVLHKKC